MTDLKNGDYNFMRYVGYNEHTPCEKIFFSQITIRQISNKVTQLLQGVDKHNRPIIVPDHIIKSVMDSIFINYRPSLGDIYSRFIVPSGSLENDVQNMIDQTIEIIVTDVKTNLGIEENNQKLTVWTTILGEHNEHGLRSHPQIKIRERRPQPMQFNMNY